MKKHLDKQERMGYNNMADFDSGESAEYHGEVLKLAEEAPLLRV